MTKPPQRRPLDLGAMLANTKTKIVVTCGSGGVGKTTTAAAMALWAADSGRKVAVLTIDPAKRLAQSLGLDELDNDPVNQRWQQFMEPLFEPVPDKQNGERFAMLKEVFYLE